MVAQRGQSSRGAYVDRFESGDAVRRYGLVAGHLSDLSDVLDCTPTELLDALERSEVTPLVDTARQKEKKDRDRSTDPSLRCLAFTERDFRRLAAAIGAREATDADSVPAERR